MAYDLQLSHIGKVYDNGTPAVIDFNLDVEKGEFIAFLGPSGCGKTTTLRMIAGFETITSGDLMIRGKRVNDLVPLLREFSIPEPVTGGLIFSVLFAVLYATTGVAVEFVLPHLPRRCSSTRLCEPSTSV